jgi:hypothetical protein
LLLPRELENEEKGLKNDERNRKSGGKEIFI